MSEITLLVKARNEASAVLQQVKGDLQSLGSSAESMKATLQSAGASVRNVGLGLSAGVTAPVAAIGATGLHAAADFETAMNTIAVVTGATADTISQMRTIALQLGIETSFSATEAASAMLELGKAGMSTEQVMNAISGTLDLAAAAGMTVADAATISANAINAFGLDASQAGVVADMFAAAANSSSIEMHDMAMSMKMSGAVFAANKVPIEDLSTAIAILGNSGLIGSDAGTALKTMLMRLTAPTDDAAEAMRSLGLQVYNADGTMRAFPDILAQMEQALYGVNQVTVSSSNLTGEQADRIEYLGGRIASTQRKIADYQSGIEGANLSDDARAKAIAELNASLSAQQAEYQQLAAVGSSTSTVFRQLTDEQRQNYLTTIFGADAIRAASILTQEGAAAYAEMKESVTEAGAATLVADARMKGLGGALLYLKGTIESTLITAVSPFLPALAQMARQAADALASFARLPEGLRNAVVVFAAVAAAVGPLLVVLGMLTSAVGAALPVLAAIGGAFGALASPIGLLIAAVVGLGAAWATNFGGIRDATVPVVDAVVGAFSRIGAALSVLGSSSSWSALKATVVSAVQAISGALDGLFSGRLSIPNFVGQLQQQFSQVRGAVSGLLSGADFGALGDSILAALGLKDVDFSAVSASLQQFVANVVAGIASFDWGGALAEIGGSLNGFTSSIANAMAAIDWGGALGAAGDWLGGLTGAIANAMGSIDWGGALAVGGDWLGGLTTSIANAMGGVDWGGALGAAGDWLGGLTTSIANAMAAIDWGGAFASANGAATALRDGVFHSLSASIAGIDWSGLGMNVTGFVDAIAAAIRGIDWSSIKAETAFAALAPHAAAAIAGLRWVFTSDSFAGLLSSVTGAISSIDWGGIGDSFATLGASVMSAIQSLDWSNIQNAFDGLRTSVVSAVTGIDWGGAVTAIGDGATALRDGVFGWLTNAISSIDFRSASLNFASLIDSVAASIASIDWSSIQAEHLFAALVAPVTSAIAGLTWLFGSDSFAGLTSAVGSALASIDWGSIGASFGGLTTAVANAMAGLDWSTVTNGIQAAQTSAQQAADGFDFFGAVGGAVGGIGQTMNDLRDSILAGLTDALASLDLTGAFTGLLDAMTSQIASIDWSTVGSSLAASLSAALTGIQWVFSPSTWAGLGSAVSSALSSALNPETLKGAAVAAFATLAPTVAAALAGVAWVVSSDNFAGLGTAARNAIASLDWSAVGASFDKLKSSVVNALGDFVSGFGAGFTWQWPEWEWPVWKWPALPEWKWPEWTWPELPKFSWPAFPTFSWPSFPSFSWPAFPSFSWPAMPSWWPFGGEAANNQLGASYFGGGWSWVGEAGRELVRLPRGTEILPNRRAEQLAAAGGGVHLTIEQMIVREEADIYALAYQVAAVLTRG